MSGGSGRTCTGTTLDGTRCKATPQSGSKFCYFHDPKKERERRAARRAGGIARSHRATILPPDTPDRSLATAEDVHSLLRDTVNRVLRGELDPKAATTVGYLAGLLIRALEQNADDQRLAELEAEVIELRQERLGR